MHVAPSHFNSHFSSGTLHSLSSVAFCFPQPPCILFYKALWLRPVTLYHVLQDFSSFLQGCWHVSAVCLTVWIWKDFHVHWGTENIRKFVCALFNYAQDIRSSKLWTLWCPLKWVVFKMLKPNKYQKHDPFVFLKCLFLSWFGLPDSVLDSHLLQINVLLLCTTEDLCQWISSLFLLNSLSEWGVYTESCLHLSQSFEIWNQKSS